MTGKQPNQQPNPQDYSPPYYEDEINLIDYLRVLWRWKWLIVAGTMLCTIAVIGITVVKYPAKQVTECMISLNFPGIEKHHNPDGTLFEKRQIITPAILARASVSLQKNDEKFPENIREMIDIHAVIPPEIRAKIQAAEKRKESYSFFPNQFILSLTLEQDDIFSIQKRNQILLSIVDEYRKSFEGEYGKVPLVVSSFPADFLLNSDYLNVVNNFKIKTDTLIKILETRIETAGFFRSKKTGDSFVDIKDGLILLNSITIHEVEATINTLKLTKDKEGLINIYKHKIRSINTMREKKEREALIARKLLREVKQSGRYELPIQKGGGGEKGGTSLVLDTSFIKDLVKEDSSALLLKTALEAEIQANNLEVDKAFLEREIVLLEEKKNNKEEEKKGAFVLLTLQGIESKIIDLSKRTNELNKEYLSKMLNNAVQVIRQAETKTTREKSLKKVALLAGIAALFMFVFLAFFIEYMRNASKEE